MKKRIISILCVIALLATMLSVGIVSATAAGKANIDVTVVDDQGTPVDALNAGDSAWAVVTLSDYEDGMADATISDFGVLMQMDAESLTVRNVSSGLADVAKNDLDGVLSFTSSNLALTADALASANGELFRVEVVAKTVVENATAEVAVVDSANETMATYVSLTTAQGEKTLLPLSAKADANVAVRAADAGVTEYPLDQNGNWTTPNTTLMVPSTNGDNTWHFYQNGNGTVNPLTEAAKLKELDLSHGFHFTASAMCMGWNYNDNVFQVQIGDYVIASAYATDKTVTVSKDGTVLATSAAINTQENVLAADTGLQGDGWNSFGISFDVTLGADGTLTVKAANHVHSGEVTVYSEKVDTAAFKNAATSVSWQKGWTPTELYNINMSVTEGTTEPEPSSSEESSSEASSEESSSEEPVVEDGEYPLDQNADWTTPNTALMVPSTNGDNTWHFYQNNNGWVQNLTEAAKLKNLDLSKGFHFTAAATCCSYNFNESVLQVQIGDYVIASTYAKDKTVTVSKDGTVLATSGEVSTYNTAQVIDAAGSGLQFSGNNCYSIAFDVTMDAAGNLTVKAANPAHPDDTTVTVFSEKVDASAFKDVATTLSWQKGWTHAELYNVNMTVADTTEPEPSSSEESSSEESSSEESSSEESSSEESSGEESSSEVSSDDTPSTDTPSDDTPSETPSEPVNIVKVSGTLDLLPDADKVYWTGDIDQINADGKFVSKTGYKTVAIETVDHYNLGTKVVMNARLLFIDGNNGGAYAEYKIGDFSMRVVGPEESGSTKRKVEFKIGDQIVETVPVEEPDVNRFKNMPLQLEIDTVTKTVKYDISGGYNEYSMTTKKGEFTYDAELDLTNAGVAITKHDNWLAVQTDSMSLTGNASNGVVIDKIIEDAMVQEGFWTGSVEQIVDGAFSTTNSSKTFNLISTDAFDLTKGIVFGVDLGYNNGENQFGEKGAIIAGKAQLEIVAGKDKDPTTTLNLKYGDTVLGSVVVNRADMNGVYRLILDTEAKTLKATKDGTTIHFTSAEDTTQTAGEFDISLLANDADFADQHLGLQLSSNWWDNPPRTMKSAYVSTPTLEKGPEAVDYGEKVEELILTKIVNDAENPFWTGDVDRIVEENFTSDPNGSGTKTIKTVALYDLTKGFTVGAAINLANNSQNVYGKAAIIEAGPAVLKLVEPIRDQDKTTWDLQLVYDGEVLGSLEIATMGEAVDDYRIVYTIKDDKHYLSATKGDEPVTFTTADGATATEFEIAVDDTTFAKKNITLSIPSNWLGGRFMTDFYLATGHTKIDEPEDPSSGETPSDTPSEDTPSSDTPSTDTPSDDTPSTGTPSDTPSSDDPIVDDPGNGSGNGGNGSGSGNGETVEYYYYLDNGTYGAATGDTSNMLAAVVVLVLSTLSVAYVCISRKRKSN